MQHSVSSSKAFTGRAKGEILHVGKELQCVKPLAMNSGDLSLAAKGKNYAKTQRDKYRKAALTGIMSLWEN